MEIKVRNMDFMYDMEGVIVNVGVRFDSHDASDGTNFNGIIRISVEEYLANATNLDAIGDIVVAKLRVKIGG